MKTIKINTKILSLLDEAINISLEFEKITNKQLNITSIVGEIIASNKHNLELVENDLNEGFDAIDENGKRVQIKTRRYKGKDNAMTGKMLDSNFDVPFDYVILILLNIDYSFKEEYITSSDEIKKHFERINHKRIANGKSKRNTMSISQFKKLT